MILSQILVFLANLGNTILTFLLRSPAPTATSPGTPQTRAVQLILSVTESLGPMLGTGGVIHAVSAATAPTLVTYIFASASKNRVAVSMLMSTLRGESDFDPNALDTNNENVVPGESADQLLQNDDVGEAQGNIASVRGNPMFAGMTDEQIDQKLLDPQIGIELCAQIIASNLAFAKAAFLADASLATKVPNGDSRILGAQAYNSGQRGAVGLARSGAALTYGVGVVSRADEWAPIVDGA